MLRDLLKSLNLREKQFSQKGELQPTRITVPFSPQKIWRNAQFSYNIEKRNSRVDENYSKSIFEQRNASILGPIIVSPLPAPCLGIPKCSRFFGERERHLLQLTRTTHLSWGGLLVEPNPDYLGSLINKNRNAWIFPYCLSPKKYPVVVDFDTMHYFSGIINNQNGVSLRPADIIDEKSRTFDKYFDPHIGKNPIWRRKIKVYILHYTLCSC